MRCLTLEVVGSNPTVLLFLKSFLIIIFVSLLIPLGFCFVGPLVFVSHTFVGFRRILKRDS